MPWEPTAAVCNITVITSSGLKAVQYCFRETQICISFWQKTSYSTLLLRTFWAKTNITLITNYYHLCPSSIYMMSYKISWLINYNSHTKLELINCIQLINCSFVLELINCIHLINCSFVWLIMHLPRLFLCELDPSKFSQTCLFEHPKLPYCTLFVPTDRLNFLLQGWHSGGELILVACTHVQWCCDMSRFVRVSTVT